MKRVLLAALLALGACAPVRSGDPENIVSGVFEDLRTDNFVRLTLRAEGGVPGWRTFDLHRRLCKIVPNGQPTSHVRVSRVADGDPPLDTLTFIDEYGYGGKKVTVLTVVRRSSVGESWTLAGLATGPAM